MKDRPLHLTTKEVADLLRVKERKVYDLAAAGEIPHRRITGKLLFPTAEVMAWIEGCSGVSSAVVRPDVLTGSHDPLIDWAVRESGSGLATLWNGSLGGLEVFAAGGAAACGMHIPDGSGWNVETVSEWALKDSVLIACAVRSRGLLLSPDLAGKIKGFADLKGKRLVRRQPGAGTATLLAILLAESGLSESDFVSDTGVARTESEAAAAVSAGDADATLGVEAMARQFHLGFLPIRQENFDLLIDRRAYFTEPVQTLMAFINSEPFRAKARSMGGYDLGDLGRIRWLSR